MPKRSPPFFELYSRLNQLPFRLLFGRDQVLIGLNDMLVALWLRGTCSREFAVASGSEAGENQKGIEINVLIRLNHIVNGEHLGATNHIVQPPYIAGPLMLSSAESRLRRSASRCPQSVRKRAKLIASCRIFGARAGAVCRYGRR